jgi:hypothetical protein
MPTENRSSNTEQMVSELLPCPFCGQRLELSNRKYNHWARCATDGCKGGQLPLLNTELAADIVSWNTRAQHQGDPVAVMYADGMMLTKADCGPAFETVCKVETPLYLHPPTSDGFSAGDMADQGAKAFAARDGEVHELRAKLAEAQEVLRDCIEVGDLDAETQWKAERVSKGRRLYVDDRALAICSEQQPGDNWHMNPCKKGHRDVGACNGKAFCHQCDEMITAATTQEAFEQWNATHPAASTPNTPE